MSQTYKELRDFLEKGAQNTWAYISSSPLYGLCICDHNGIIVHVNDLHEYITDHKGAELIGTSMARHVELGHIDHSTTVEVLKSKRSMLVEQSRPGRGYIVKTDPIFDGRGEVAYVVSILMDVTLERSLKVHLEQTREDNVLMQRQLKELQNKLHAQCESGNPGEEHEFLYVSKQMRDVHAQIRYIADSSTAVLITGESGVGKELAARTIQRTSRRQDMPFISINCAAVPSELLESELFGYVGGAFTNSRPGGKAGLFESVQGGTIFLDEIGEMPRKLQAKLLRVLQEKEVRRVGGTENIPVDVRIIAATNQDLESLIERGKFRADLYYRLNVIPIRIPPLRERKDDVPILAYFFLDASNRKYGKNKVISQEGYNYLVTLQYQGNVRQLENTIERLVLLCQEEHILPADIESFYGMTEKAQGPRGNAESANALHLPRPTGLAFVGSGAEPDNSVADKWKQRVRTEEERMICEMAGKGMSTYKIARQLGLNQSTVWRKLRNREKEREASSERKQE